MNHIGVWVLGGKPNAWTHSSDHPFIIFECTQYRRHPYDDACSHESQKKKHGRSGQAPQASPPAQAAADPPESFIYISA